MRYGYWTPTPEHEERAHARARESGSFERGEREHTNANPVRSEWAASCHDPEGGDECHVSLMCHLRLNPFVTRPRTAKLFLNQLDQSISILTICTNEGLPAPV